MSSLTYPKVLAVTKRISELCATQALLHAAGFELITATNLKIARAVINTMHVKGVIVCRHSWSDDERDSIVSELKTLCPELAVIVRCPGCTGCDEAACKAGSLQDTLPITQLIAALSRQGDA